MSHHKTYSYHVSHVPTLWDWPMGLAGHLQCLSLVWLFPFIVFHAKYLIMIHKHPVEFRFWQLHITLKHFTHLVSPLIISFYYRAFLCISVDFSSGWKNFFSILHCNSFSSFCVKPIGLEIMRWSVPSVNSIKHGSISQVCNTRIGLQYSRCGCSVAPIGL